MSGRSQSRQLSDEQNAHELTKRQYAEHVSQLRREIVSIQGEYRTATSDVAFLRTLFAKERSAIGVTSIQRMKELFEQKERESIAQLPPYATAYPPPDPTKHLFEDQFVTRVRTYQQTLERQVHQRAGTPPSPRYSSP